MTGFPHRVLAVALIGFWSISGQAEDLMRAQAVAVFKHSVTQDCTRRDGMAACLGIDSGRCVSAAGYAAGQCAELIPLPTTEGDPSEEAQNAFTQCVQESFARKARVTEQRVLQCANQTSRASATPEPYGDSESATYEQIMERSAGNLKQIQEMVAAAAKAVPMDRVTLPLYPNRSVTAHYPQGLSMGGDSSAASVSVVMMTSRDRPEKVLAFYRKQLSGFTYSEFYGSHLFVKDPPAGFEPKDIKIISTLPHVMISEFGDGEAKTQIQVGYLP